MDLPPCQLVWDLGTGFLGHDVVSPVSGKNYSGYDTVTHMEAVDNGPYVGGAKVPRALCDSWAFGYAGLRGRPIGTGRLVGLVWDWG